MDENTNNNVLVIGAGMGGIQASLLLAEAGKQVYLVEKEPLFGGNVIKYEEVFPNMECSTCMIAPKQQEVLQNPNIELMTHSIVEDVQGSVGNFSVKIKKKARYVSLVNCIGCGACYDPCPVSLDNEFEQNLSQKKAIYIPCPGALPNVPVIDPEYCTRLKGVDECSACKDSCMFEAIEYDQKDEILDVKVTAVIVATGFGLFDITAAPKYGYGKVKNVYSAFEFERLFAKNGPTEGNTVLKGGENPNSIAIIHCVGRKELGYCSGVCCMYSYKFSQYLKHSFPDAKVFQLYSDMCVPGKSYQKFYKQTMDKGVDFIYHEDVEVKGNGSKIKLNVKNGKDKDQELEVDMVILAQSLKSTESNSELAKILGIEQDDKGFFVSMTESFEPASTAKPGIYVVGCSEAPKDVPQSIAQAEAAVGKVLALT
ncbi:CoB--CoM heterodisulfide reductase iron-sulfur subunit A family protein [bacterium]|nr:CoB--CoM heterodisulfide reductase iron-sulfur subunit A family protein [bacterium]